MRRVSHLGRPMLRRHFGAQKKLAPFHAALPVHNLEECKLFYRNVLRCEEGRTASEWADYNFFGHQIVLHYKPKPESATSAHTNPVDGQDVPVPHWGVVLPWEDFWSFANDLKRQEIQFVIEPYIRFKGQVGEQATMFFFDPAGNALEFKAFQDMDQLFAKDEK